LKKIDTFEAKEKIVNISTLSNTTRISQDPVQKQLTYVWKNICTHSGFVLDIASGMGLLVNKLFTSTKFDIIASDISYFILRDSYNNLSAAKNARLTKMAFDATASPFRNGSVDMITNYSGLQNIPAVKSTLKEIYRICNDTFYCITSFSPNDDETNRIKKETYNLSDELIMASEKNSCMKFIREAGFRVECDNSESIFTPKAPRSAFIPNFGFDALPIADSVFENCTLIAKKINI